MKLARMGFFLCGLALGMAAQPAGAAPGDSGLELGIGVGIPTSVNDFSESAKVGPAFRLGYLRAINDKLSLGGRVHYLFFGAETRRLASTLGGQVDTESESVVGVLEIVAKYTPGPERKYQPYLIGGIGANHFSQESDGKPAPGSLWADTSTNETRDLGDESSSGYALSIGGGLEMDLNGHWGLGLEALWHTFGVDDDDFGSSTINVPSVVLNIAYSF